MSSLLTQLQNTKDLASLAELLGYKTQSLSFILYRIPDEKKYKTFEIDKKNGQKRTISAPIDKLKQLQENLASLLSECLKEIDGNNKTLSHGFKDGYSIITNAKCHQNRRHVLNFDLEDFFGSIHFGRVRGYFIKNNNFELSEKVATIIAQICCHDNKLPQGSPCSPVVSNLIAHILDINLVNEAKKNNCFYSRYADDITFSTNKKEFPKKIARINKSNEFELHPKIMRVLKHCHFNVNTDKTRLQHESQRQVVTGLVVNNKVNIRRDYYLKSRALVHNYLTYGNYKIQSEISPFDITTEEDIDLATPEKLGGILSHINLVKESSDLRSYTEKRNNPTQFRKMYKDFLFFSHFGKSNKPLIICEGITDDIYIKSALKNMHVEYSNLVSLKSEKFNFNVKFLKFTKTVTDILELCGGTGDMKTLIGSYQKNIRQIRAWEPEFPVIILTDNDTGGIPVFSAANEIINPYKKGGNKKNRVREKNGSSPSINSDDDFYYICHNLYLVKTPHMNNKSETCIESFFTNDILNHKLGAKSFRSDDDLVNKNKSLYYGKRIFAEQVINRKYKTIDFKEFKPLINRINAVIIDFKKRRTSVQ